nr:unnamed protein product [Callosobruchus analis]
MSKLNEYQEIVSQDKCRVCKRVFCCSPCRDVHETSKHNFLADCDICKYGQTILSSISAYSQGLLDHLKTSHFPLRCDLCKRTFNTIDDVYEHIKCPEANKVHAKDDGKSPKTPAQISHDTNFDSPPLTNLLVGKNLIDKNITGIGSLATSTPMHHGGGNLGKVQEVIITPVQSSENTKNSILKNPNSQCNSFKRVTFYGTPFVENSHRKPKNMVMEGASIGDLQSSKNVDSKAVLSISPSRFYSAKTEQTSNPYSPSVHLKTNDIVDETKPKQYPENDEKNQKEMLDTSCEPVDKTVWISALNISVEICSDEDEHAEFEEVKPTGDNVDEEQDKNGQDKEQILEDDEKLQGMPKTNFATPSASKVTSRKISIVKPTPAKKERKEEELFVDMIQTYSTPNVPRTIQPSAPSMFAPGDSNPPISTICGESTTSGVSIIAPNSSATTANEVVAQNSVPVLLKFEDSVVNLDENSDIKCNTSNARISKGNTIWTSVSNILSNIFHNFSGVDASYEDRANRSLKRCSSDNDLFGPLRKKHKLTDIKCRRPIRDLPPLTISSDLQINIRVNMTEGNKKIYVLALQNSIVQKLSKQQISIAHLFSKQMTKPKKDLENVEKNQNEMLDTSCEPGDKTVWISAVNISAEICSGEDERGEYEEAKTTGDNVDEGQDENCQDKDQTSEDDEKLQGMPKTNFTTPSASKVTNTTISIVQPIPTKNERKEEELFVDMIQQTYSTPNVPHTIQPSAPSMFAPGDSNPRISTICGESTTCGVSIIALNSSATTANEVAAQNSVPVVLKFEDSSVNLNENSDVNCNTSDAGISKRNTIWTSVSNILSNIFHNFSGADTSYEDRVNRSLKRCSSDNDRFGPLRKKHKLTDIKC